MATLRWDGILDPSHLSTPRARASREIRVLDAAEPLGEDVHQKRDNVDLGIAKNFK
jgi:hypothetical protein